MSKKFLIIDEDQEEITHVIKVSEDKIKLRRSKSEIWTESCRGENLGVLKDNGNGIHIKLNSTELDLNYSEFMELFHLIHAKVKTDPNL